MLCTVLQESDLQQDGGAAVDAAAAATPQPLAPAERAALLQRLPPDVSPSASAAVAALAGVDTEVGREWPPGCTAGAAADTMTGAACCDGEDASLLHQTHLNPMIACSEQELLAATEAAATAGGQRLQRLDTESGGAVDH